MSSDAGTTRRGRMEHGFVRVWLSACLIGAIAGFLSSIFRLAVEGLSAIVHDHAHSASLLISMAFPAVMVGITLWLVRRYAPEAAGSGVQEIEGALEGIRPVRWRRLLPVKFFGGLLSLGGGMVVGREGPTVQMGANVGGMVHSLLRLPRKSAHALLAAGAAAGLSAAFNAPLSGVLFVIEEMRRRFRYGFLSVQAVVVASACADITARLVTSQRPVFQFAPFPAPPISTLWLFPLFGAGMGVIGVVFNRSLMTTLRGMDRLTENRRLLVGVGIGALIGLGSWAWHDVASGGYSAITDAVALRFAARSLVFLFVLRFVATVLSYGSGIPGGIFTPMLALGTLLGVTVGLAVNSVGAAAAVHPAAFAVVGMGALFASTVRAPLTGMALAIELTASFDLILPLLMACSVSTLVAEVLGGKPIYEQLLARTMGTNDEN